MLLSEMLRFPDGSTCSLNLIPRSYIFLICSATLLPILNFDLQFYIFLFEFLICSLLSRFYHADQGFLQFGLIDVLVQHPLESHR